MFTLNKKSSKCTKEAEKEGNVVIVGCISIGAFSMICVKNANTVCTEEEVDPLMINADTHQGMWDMAV